MLVGPTVILVALWLPLDDRDGHFVSQNYYY